jgi:hypothetical protein
MDLLLSGDENEAGPDSTVWKESGPVVNTV